jgi:hypothetical protein
MKKSISLFSQLHKKAIFYGILGESGWFPQMPVLSTAEGLASRKTTAENTKLAETVSICVNPCLISSCLSVFVAISFRVIPHPESSVGYRKSSIENMQNKPNLPNAKMNVNYCLTKVYEQ